MLIFTIKMAKNKTISVLVLIVFFASVFGFSAFAQTVPSVTTGSADMISARNVYLNASVNPNGSHTNVWFQIDTSNTPIGFRGYQGAGSGSSTVNVRAGIINLHLDTTYYYRAVAQNSSGTVYGEIRSFRTGSNAGSTSSSSVNTNQNSSSLAGSNYSYNGSTSTSTGSPLVATNGPVSVSNNSAVINGSINPNGANTNFWFEFGLTQSLGQKTTVQSAGNSNAWQLVTGNLSGLETGKTYYYKVFAQNNYGINSGEVKSFTTGHNFGQSGNGQVAGATTSVSGNNSSGSKNSGALFSKTTGGNTNAASGIKNQPNSRPSFISLEYSLENESALVMVADKKAVPGEDFSYSVVYKNETLNSFDEAVLKVIIPSDSSFIGSNIEPAKTEGNIVEFSLGDIEPGNQGAVTVIVNIKETAVSESNLIFTSVLGYKDSKGVQLATTSYLMTKVNEGGSKLAASFFGIFLNSSGFLWLVALGLVLLMAVLTYGLVRVKKRNGLNNGDSEKQFELNSIPATFEPASAPMDKNDFGDIPMGKPDIFRPVR